MTTAASTFRQPSIRAKRTSTRLILPWLAGVLLGLAVAVWGLAAVASMATRSAVMLDQGPRKPAIALVAAVPQADGTDGAQQRHIRIPKFRRLSQPTPDELRQASLTPEAIKASRQKMMVLASQRATQRLAQQKQIEAVAVASAALSSGAVTDAVQGPQPALLTAMIEPERDTSAARPFGLVLAQPETLADATVPEEIPMPEARPQRRIAAAPATREPAASPRSRERDKEIAYAKPDGSLFDGIFGGNKGRSPGAGTRIAIYDISAGLVHMPNGERLEAHSGIGKMRDNPKHVHVKMRGSTPPGTFRLTMREKLFHGVEALRMTPVDGINPHGRDGLLTHSYLLGPNGNSHGCVAFKNYKPFLNAFKRGQINTLIVVPRMPASRSQVAALYRRGV